MRELKEADENVSTTFFFWVLLTNVLRIMVKEAFNAPLYGK